MENEKREKKMCLKRRGNPSKSKFGAHCCV